MREYHSSPLGGHAVVFKTCQRIAVEWFWRGMKKDITNFVQSCHVRQQNKMSTLSPAGLLQPLPILSTIWEDILWTLWRAFQVIRLGHGVGSNGLVD